MKAYRDGSLVTIREGENGLICLGDDPADDRWHVACYHEDLEPFMARGRELRAQGITGRAQIDSIRQAEIESGELAFPDHPAALYSWFGRRERLQPGDGGGGQRAGPLRHLPAVRHRGDHRADGGVVAGTPVADVPRHALGARDDRALTASRGGAATTSSSPSAERPHDDRGLFGAEHAVQSTVALISIAVGLLVFGLSRRMRDRPQLLLDIRLGFEVVGAFGISISTYWAICGLHWNPHGDAVEGRRRPPPSAPTTRSTSTTSG